MASITCPNCETANPDGAKFCHECGVELEVTAGAEAEINLHALKPSTPQEGQEKSSDPKAPIEGERKPVTILFADIVGSTSHAEKLDPEEWKEIVQGAHSRVIEAVNRYEGTIAQLLGDGVLAFFGAPITHEDDPIRAVYSALDIQDSITEYGRELTGYVDDFQMRIGINTGEVVIGDIGTDQHMEYLAIGDAVNVAARLESAAQPGQVVVSEGMAARVKAKFETQDLGELKVKGKAEPLQAYAVLEVKAEPEMDRGLMGERTPYVGRADQVEKLRSALLSLCEGHGQIVTILGEAGIGKTRLLEQVQDELSEWGGEGMPHSPSSIRWLEGRSLSFGGSLSFWPITQLLLADLGLSDSSPEVKIKVALRKRVEAMFGEEAGEVFPYLAHLLDLRMENDLAEQVQAQDGETLKYQTMQSLKAYFGRAAEDRPTVVVMEDMHWADPSSLEAIYQLMAVADRGPLMVLMLMRIDRDHGSWEMKTRGEIDFPHRYSEINLRQLGEEESGELVKRLLGSGDLPKEIFEAVLSRSEGNPFYVEEVIRHLIEGGLILQENGSWRWAKGASDIGIPDTLHGVLLARIDRLEEGVRRTLQLASVIGRSFHYRVLKEVSEGGTELEGHLTQLQRLDLVREKARFPELEYMFKHALIKEAAYNSLLMNQRRVVHLRVGEAIEQLFPERQTEFFGVLAHHFEAAEAGEKAVDYLLRAGDKARFGEALSEAKEFYHRALAILAKMEDDDRAARTWLKLGLISMENFEFEAAYRANEAAFAYQEKARSKVRSDKATVEALEEGPKTFRISHGGLQTKLDPGKITWVLEAVMTSQLFAGLAEMDSESNVIPHVARSWEVLDEGRRYLFHLRQDVYWTDGTQVTAGDFEWAWIRNLALGMESSGSIFLGDIVGASEFRLGKNTDPSSVGVQALDDFTLEVRLNLPVAYFIYLVVLPFTFPLPRAIVEEYGDEWWKPEHIVSNGAFRLEGYGEANKSLVRNSEYFADFPGNVNRIEWLFVSKPEDRILEYIREKVDAVSGVPPKAIHPEVPQDQIHRFPTSSTSYLVMNPTRPPMNDVRVRRALAQSIDRGRVMEASAGPGIPLAHGGFIPIGLPGHSPEIGLKYDVGAAKHWFEEARDQADRDLPVLVLYVLDAPSIIRAAKEIADQWYEVLGIETKILPTKDDSSLSSVEEPHGFVGGWVADFPDPDNFLRRSSPLLALQQWGWDHPHYEELIESAAHTSDRARRLEIYREADRLLVADEVLVQPCAYTGEWASATLLKPWVKNFRRNLTGGTSFKEIVLERDHGEK